ncbi:glycerophosphodiester phosphodiesterase family protein [Halobacillus kuroshimensis]|uniref:glycerophosphodiester phosphodiesterase family protein n=1 Tax=Halobacillus kuroshimensis TaxID=302481 RepID=UPI000415B683|nr:glycerophosphodiester phosphodiesterase family protein [Halobacillus kuroshimensis]
MAGKKEYQHINGLLSRKLEEKQVLTAVHRGLPGGNIIENTIPAFQAALRLRSDALEIDVSRTADGDFYLFHDGEEKRLFGVDQNIREMTTEAVAAMTYYNSLSLPVSYRVESLDDGLRFLKGDTLLNIDRSWQDWAELLPLLDGYDMMDQLILKSPVHRDYLGQLQNHERKYMYMPIVQTVEELEVVMSSPGINLVGIELIADSEDHPLFDDAVIRRVHDAGLFVWANAITLDDEKILYAGLDDNTSLIHGPEHGWGRLIDKGVDMIQTDWPSLLVPYIDGKLNR